MPLFGILPVDKPHGMSSRRVVDMVERIVEPDRVGHTGTLDPLATGVLLLAIGNATRLVEFAHDMRKGYEATFEFGKSSDTLDIEGDVEVLDNLPVPTESSIAAELQKWIGTVRQVPPQYSALNVAGRRAYKLARRGIAMQLPAREIAIHQMTILEFAYPFLKLSIFCGSGTYVRSIGRDIAEGLGTKAVMTALTRTQVGPFRLEDCVKDQDIRARSDVVRYLASPRLMLCDWPVIELDAQQSIDIRHGRQIELERLGDVARAEAIDAEGKLVGLLEPAQASPMFRSLRVFQTATDEIQPTSTNIRQRPES
jgi:tRNA pseudouridine55 synthase